jgi:transposase
MLTNGEIYTDPGPDYFIRQRPAQTQIRAIHQLEALGYTVTLEPRPAA